MLGFNVFAADTDAEARLRATSMQQAFVNLRTGRPSQLPPPVPGYLEQLGPQERAMLDSVLSCTAIGAPETVKAKMAAFIAETGADELMITSQIFEHQHRLRSYEITAQIHAELARHISPSLPGISPYTLYPAVGNDRRDFFASPAQSRPRPAKKTQRRYHAHPKASFQESCIA